MLYTEHQGALIAYDDTLEVEKEYFSLTGHTGMAILFKNPSSLVRYKMLMVLCQMTFSWIELDFAIQWLTGCR
jgi:hypothetical protein